MISILPGPCRCLRNHDRGRLTFRKDQKKTGFRRNPRLSYWSELLLSLVIKYTRVKTHKHAHCTHIHAHICSYGFCAENYMFYNDELVSLQVILDISFPLQVNQLQHVENMLRTQTCQCRQWLMFLLISLIGASFEQVSNSVVDDFLRVVQVERLTIYAIAGTATRTAGSTMGKKHRILQLNSYATRNNLCTCACACSSDWYKVRLGERVVLPESLSAVTPNWEDVSKTVLDHS